MRNCYREGVNEHSPPGGPATMADVAEAAGVAVSTVSRALRGRPGVSSAQREQILRVADELSYSVSASASRLAGGRTGAVGVLVPRIDGWFHSTAVAGLQERLHEHGLDLVLYRLQGREERTGFFTRRAFRHRVDALVVVGTTLTPDEEELLAEAGLPVVGISTRPSGRPFADVDDRAGAAGATRHLTNLGHERIAILRSTTLLGTHGAVSHDRYAGFCGAMAERGLDVPEAYVVSAPWGLEGGAQAMAELLSAATPPTAVFAESDEVAIGALRTLRRSNVEVGRTMSVIGFDDHQLAELLDLSTVAQPVHEQGRTGGDLVVEALEHGRVAEPERVLPTRLVVRGTSAGH